ncbi:MAG: biotin/lipoyl-containing protein [Candidatus Limnocylindrales bacterium]
MADSPRDQLSRLADEVVPRLISRFSASGLGELEISHDGWRVRLRREPGPTDGAASAAERPAESRRAVGPGSAAPATSQPPAESDPKRVTVTSPAVGHYQPGEDRDIGRAVRSGDTLGHVEVLGVRNDVIASTDGVIGRVLAQPGQAVEYGQPLVRIDRVDG